MKRVFLHVKRLFRKFWFFIFFVAAISPIIGLGVLIVMTTISMLFFNDPKEENDLADYFTEEELRKIQSDEEVDEEEYLVLLAKYQTYQCPVKVDQITTWTSSEVTKDSYILHYEIYDKWHTYGEIDTVALRNNILSGINKDDNQMQCIIATNRNLVFRYWNCQDETLYDIVLTPEDLKR